MIISSICFVFIYLSIFFFFFFFFKLLFFPSLCTYCTTKMKVLCNNRPTVVNLTIGYETVMSVKRVQTALLFFVCLFVFFIAFLHFPSTIRQLPCIIDIGAHKPRLLVPFAMCNCNGTVNAMSQVWRKAITRANGEIFLTGTKGNTHYVNLCLKTRFRKWLSFGLVLHVNP